MSFFIAYLYHLMVEQINKIIRKKLFSHLICSFILLVLFLLVVVELVNFVKSEVNSIFEEIRSIWNLIATKLEIDLTSILPYVEKYIGIILNNSTDIIPTLIILPFITIYFIVYYDDILMKFYHTKFYQKNKDLIENVNLGMKSYIVNLVKITSILVVMASITFSIFNLKSPIFLGIFYGLSDIIPIFGPLISGFIISLLVLAINPAKVIWIIIVMVIMQILEEQVIAPKIHAESLDINPLIIIFSLFILGELLGMFGIFFTVPILIIIDNIYKFKKEKIEY